MKIEYDRKVDAAYVYMKDTIRSGEIKKTIMLNDNIIVDLDKNDKLVGLEILSASTTMPKGALKSITSGARPSVHAI